VTFAPSPLCCVNMLPVLTLVARLSCLDVASGAMQLMLAKSIAQQTATAPGMPDDKQLVDDVVQLDDNARKVIADWGQTSHGFIVSLAAVTAVDNQQWL
jgi:hypothetical protein